MKNFLLIGLGRFGKFFAMKTAALGHQIMAVDINEERVNDVLPYVTNALIGDSSRQDFLESLGVTNYDACIVAIGDDFQKSLETTYLLKELGAKKIVARASQDIQKKFLLNNGADQVIYPEKALAEWTAVSLSSDKILDFVALDDTYAVSEVVMPAKWIGKTLLDLDVRKRFNVNIIGAKDIKGTVKTLDPNDALRESDRLLVMGRNDDIVKLFRED